MAAAGKGAESGLRDGEAGAHASREQIGDCTRDVNTRDRHNVPCCTAAREPTRPLANFISYSPDIEITVDALAKTLQSASHEAVTSIVNRIFFFLMLVRLVFSIFNMRTYYGLYSFLLPSRRGISRPICFFNFHDK